jgi:hypothetical protein
MLEQQGRIDDLERRLEKMAYARLSPAEQETWWHFYGITAFREGRDGAARTRFEQGLSHFPGSAPLRFSLGQQVIRGGDFDAGFNLFRGAIFPAVSRELAFAAARYAYLFNRWDDGITFLLPFLPIFLELKILDDHFLYTRGMPFFAHWWSAMAAFSVLRKDFSELHKITERIITSCDVPDPEYLRLELRACREENPGLLVAPLQDWLEGIKTSLLPTGTTRLLISIAKARQAASYEDANTFLDEFAAAPQDFPWLEDMRTLAHAEIAHRFNFPDTEEELASRFLAKQPMLFEPHHALSFHLLKYQERYKPRITLLPRSRD